MLLTFLSCSSATRPSSSDGGESMQQQQQQQQQQQRFEMTNDTIFYFCGLSNIGCRHRLPLML